MENKIITALAMIITAVAVQTVPDVAWPILKSLTAVVILAIIALLHEKRKDSK